MLLAELRAKAEEASAPEPVVINVGESEHERRKKAEAKAARERAEAERQAKLAEDKRRAETEAKRKAEAESRPSWLTFVATAYTAYCDTGCQGVTKSGLDVSSTTKHKGRTIIAVDPAVIPLGSAVEIRLHDGSIIAGIAEDTGGAIRGHRIDVLVGGERQARQFGRQAVKVRIIE